MHAADPAVAETIKFKVRPYFVLEGNICALLAAKDHVNVFLYDGAIVPDPAGIITGGHDNTTARTVAFRRGEPINADALTAMFKHIIANNRAGGWRKLGANPLSGAVDDEALTASVEGLHRAETMIAAEKLRRIGEVDARKAYLGKAMSTADWAASRL